MPMFPTGVNSTITPEPTPTNGPVTCERRPITRERRPNGSPSDEDLLAVLTYADAIVDQHDGDLGPQQRAAERYDIADAIVRDSWPEFDTEYWDIMTGGGNTNGTGGLRTRLRHALQRVWNRSQYDEFEM